MRQRSEGSQFQASLGAGGGGESEIISQKYLTYKWAGRVGQVVEHLDSKHEALSLNHSTAGGKPKKRKTILKYLYKIKVLGLTLVLV
jgi:hypothetical protein